MGSSSRGSTFAQGTYARLIYGHQQLVMRAISYAYTRPEVNADLAPAPAGERCVRVWPPRCIASYALVIPGDLSWWRLAARGSG